jgi:hypothetical protein
MTAGNGTTRSGTWARRAIWLAAAAGAVCGLAGCDFGGTYSKRYNDSLVSVGKKAEIAAMLHGSPTSVPDAAGKASGVSLKLPSVLDGNSKSLPNTEARAQPPFVKLPGLNYAYERMLDDPSDPSKFAPAYCYLGAVPKAEQPADVVQAEVLRVVQATFPGSAWTDVQAGSVAVKLLSVTGQQDFDGAQIGKPVERLDGQLDL